MSTASGPPPLAIFFLGAAGSGKSTAARAAAIRLRAVYLDKDTMVSPLTQLILREHGHDEMQRESSEFYLDHVFPAEYQAVMNTARDNLRIGNPVVLDAPFLSYLDDESYFASATAAAEWPETRAYAVTVSAPFDVMRARVELRALPRDRWKLDHWDEFVQLMQSRACRWLGVTHLTLDNRIEGPIDLTPLWDAIGSPDDARSSH